jgi:Fe2+ transport system protein FeoA
MKNNSISKLNKGTNFIIEKFSLNKIQKLKLMELGILPKIKIKLLQNNFGSSIIKCEGIKYALDNSIAHKLVTTKIAS